MRKNKDTTSVRLEFPNFGEYEDLHINIKLLASKESKKRGYRVTMQDIIFELLKEKVDERLGGVT